MNSWVEKLMNPGLVPQRCDKQNYTTCCVQDHFLLLSFKTDYAQSGNNVAIINYNMVVKWDIKSCRTRARALIPC